MTTWLLLTGAIIAEVAGTLMLRATVDHPGWIPGVVLSYIMAFTLIGLTLRAGMPVGVVYGIWGAVGVALVALLGMGIFGEALSPLALAGIGTIIAGVALVETGSHQHPAPEASEHRTPEEVTA